MHHDPNIHDDIVHLEERIEALRESIARCAKISLAAKIAIGAGAVWIALVLLWIVPFAPATFLGALAAVLGGAVLLGSNKTTWEQTDEVLQKAEAMRDQFIDSLNTRLVGDERPTLH